MRALHVPDAQINYIKASLEKSAGSVEIGGKGPSIQRVFSTPDLVAAGFEEVEAE
ncbi:MAG TPA: hypothetical protein VG675_21705 [Bryobacteraceae bacterium]|nr:hypothetical protein [Bryobacteraceae bacterium]